MSPIATEQPPGVGLAALMDRLARFEGPPEAFLAQLLAAQCRMAGAGGAVVLRPAEQGKMGVLAVHPPVAAGGQPPPWIGQAVELFAAQQQSPQQVTAVLRQTHGVSAQAPQHLVLVPLPGQGPGRGAAVYLVPASERASLAQARDRLELSISLLRLYEARLAAQERGADLDRLRQAMEVLAAVNEQDRFLAAGMALCNQVAARWSADRVCLGVLRGRYVRVRAISHVDRFDRKTAEVHDIEAAMEECLDQDVEVLHPSAPQNTYVSRAAAALGARQGQSAVCSLPLRRQGQPAAVVTLERAGARPFVLAEVQGLRLACDLAAARLLEMHDRDRWAGARLAAGARRGLATLIGPRYTWVKAAALAIMGFLLFALLARGPDRIDGGFIFQAAQRRTVVAPFDGRVWEVAEGIEPGQPVFAGQVVAVMDEGPLLDQLLGARAQWTRFAKEADIALRDGKPAEQQKAEASLAEVEAEIRVLEDRLGRARVRVPMDGLVTAGDLRTRRRATVKIGEPLIEVADLGSLRADLLIPEDRAADVVRALQRGPVTGELAARSRPGQHIRFVIERISPVAEVVKQANVFRAQARIEGVDLRRLSEDWLRPGMEGVAKIDMGRRSYASLWTGDLVNWLRMKLWI